MPEPPVHDLAAVAADDELIEDVRAGARPADPPGRQLAAWRDEVQDGAPPLIYEALADEHDVEVPDMQGDDPAITGLPPLRRVEYDGHVDHPMPGQDDHLIERTDNGLRPADAAYRQPPQDPEWSPDGQR